MNEQDILENETEQIETNEMQEQKEKSILGSTLRENKQLKKEIESLKNELKLTVEGHKREQRVNILKEKFEALGGDLECFKDYTKKHYEELENLQENDFDNFINKTKEETKWAFKKELFTDINRAINKGNEHYNKESNLIEGTIYKKI